VLTGPHVAGDPEAGERVASDQVASDQVASDQVAGDQVAGEQAGLAARLAWDVGNPELFAQALAHRSWCAEHPGREPNERLEFLGDAVLGLVVTDYLYRTYPDLPEGELAKSRAAVVNSASLASTARELGLGNALFLGKGEDASGGRSKLSILADAMEAIIGAIYLDAGYSTVKAIVLELLGERLRESAKGPGDEDYKTRLQELCAQTYDELPVYRVADSGPDHAKVFHAEVTVRGRSLGNGAGRSKKQAEQMAARHAWFALKAEPSPSAAADGDAGTDADAGPSPAEASPSTAD
jgi:ribonuclease-3